MKERGVNRLIESSVKRNIKAHSLLLRKWIEVTVHTACQKQYNNEKLIAASLHGGNVSQNTPSTLRRSSNPGFNFKGHCFLCAEEISEDFKEQQKKLPMTRRDSVHLVEKLNMKDTVLRAADLRNLFQLRQSSYQQ